MFFVLGHWGCFSVIIALTLSFDFPVSLSQHMVANILHFGFNAEVNVIVTIAVVVVATDTAVVVCLTCMQFCVVCVCVESLFVFVLSLTLAFFALSLVGGIGVL